MSEVIKCPYCWKEDIRSRADLFDNGFKCKHCGNSADVRMVNLEGGRVEFELKMWDEQIQDE
jgi:transposase-like protein